VAGLNVCAAVADCQGIIRKRIWQVGELQVADQPLVRAFLELHFYTEVQV